jgi:hypothetical protein
MRAEQIMTLRVELGELLPVGRVPEGELAVIPITGGTFAGPRLRGRVLSGGADWNTRIPGGISHVCARYWIQTDDGAVICVHNEGILQSEAAPDNYQTTPRFQCDLDGPYAFLTRGLFAGTVRGAGEHAVEIGIWQIG